MSRASSWVLVSMGLLPLSAAPARADEGVDGALHELPQATSPSSKDVTRVLAGTSSAVVGTTPALTAAWAGYDGAAQAPVFSVGTEVRVLRRLSLVAGVAYGTAVASAIGLRPQLGARVQLLDQGAAGVDATAVLTFRQDRFTSEDGLFQGTLAFGRTFGTLGSPGETTVLLNLVYSQDGEGDDHEGEVRLAAVRRAHGGLLEGAEARYMRSIDSTDPHRAELGTPSMEAMAGPLVAYTAGRWTFVAEAGVSTRRTTRLDTGVVTMGGLGTTF